MSKPWNKIRRIFICVYSPSLFARGQLESSWMPWRLSASRWPNWGPLWNPPYITTLSYRGIYMRPLIGPLLCREIWVSKYEFFHSGIRAIPSVACLTPLAWPTLRILFRNPHKLKAMRSWWQFFFQTESNRIVVAIFISNWKQYDPSYNFPFKLKVIRS